MTVRRFFFKVSFLLFSSLVFGSEISHRTINHSSENSVLSLKILPAPGTIYLKSSSFYTGAHFSIMLKNDEQPVKKHPLSISIEGPLELNWTGEKQTDDKGSYVHSIFITPLPVGEYKMTVTAQYDNKIITAETIFLVQWH
jgi:hypothetical protein